MPSSRKATGAAAFGARLRELRVAKGMTQGDLATQLGIDAATISKLETGCWDDQGPSLKRLCELAKALDVEPSRLVDS